jgi:hypothetical protein
MHLNSPDQNRSKQVDNASAGNTLRKRGFGKAAGNTFAHDLLTARGQGEIAARDQEFPQRFPTRDHCRLQCDPGSNENPPAFRPGVKIMTRDAE